MAKIADVSTLQDWLSRTRAMDDALATLWQTMIETKGKVTVQVTAALKNVNSAKALLPDSTAVMGIALHEMAGGLTSDGISIETAKGHLAERAGPAGRQAERRPIGPWDSGGPARGRTGAVICPPGRERRAGDRLASISRAGATTAPGSAAPR